jgi:UDPglucose--hexose-1-phosphate uridylyltransferase
MPEIRIDPLTGLRAIVAGDRAQRPGGELGARPVPALDPETDPFAEGHEDRTPPEVYAVRPNGGGPDTPGWVVRVVPNLYPALSEESGRPEPEANPDLFWAGPAQGAHEVIINAPDPVMSLSQLAPDQVVAAVEVWRERMRTHREASYVHLSVNERAEAGASLPHTHAQLYALDFVPAAIARERERFGAYATRTMGGNLLADLVQEEVRRRERVVAIDQETVLMAPYGARVPFQLMIAPRTPRMRFEDDGATGARMLHGALSRLARRLGASPPLNLWVRTAPRGSEHFCWRIDILPRLTHLAGLELGAGVNLNIVPPELVAAELRDLS